MSQGWQADPTTRMVMPKKPGRWQYCSFQLFPSSAHSSLFMLLLPTDTHTSRELKTLLLYFPFFYNPLGMRILKSILYHVHRASPLFFFSLHLTPPTHPLASFLLSSYLSHHFCPEVQMVVQDIVLVGKYSKSCYVLIWNMPLFHDLQV